MHDALAVAEAVSPGIVTTERLAVAVECGSGPARGATAVDRLRVMDWEPNVDVAVGLDREAFAELLLSRLAALDAGSG